MSREWLPKQAPGLRGESAERRMPTIRPVDHPRLLRKGEFGDWRGVLYRGLGEGRYERVGGGAAPQPGTQPQVNMSAHNLLDGSVHADTLAGTVARGDLVVGNGAPKWSRLALGTDGQVLRSDGTDALWAQLQHDDLGGVTADQHHARLHALNSASDHSGQIQTSQIQDNAITPAKIANQTRSIRISSDEWREAGAVITPSTDPAMGNIYGVPHIVWSSSNTDWVLVTFALPPDYVAGTAITFRAIAWMGTGVNPAYLAARLYNLTDSLEILAETEQSLSASPTWEEFTANANLSSLQPGDEISIQMRRGASSSARTVQARTFEVRYTADY